MGQTCKTPNGAQQHGSAPRVSHVARTPGSGLPPRRVEPPLAGASERRGPLTPILSGVPSLLLEPPGVNGNLANSYSRATSPKVSTWVVMSRPEVCLWPETLNPMGVISFPGRSAVG